MRVETGEVCFHLEAAKGIITHNRIQPKDSIQVWRDIGGVDVCRSSLTSQTSIISASSAKSSSAGPQFPSKTVAPARRRDSVHCSPPA